MRVRRRKKAVLLDVKFKRGKCEKNQKNQGGAKNGHKGHGRQSISEEEADEIIEIPAPECCPECSSGIMRF